MPRVEEIYQEDTDTGLLFNPVDGGRIELRMGGEVAEYCVTAVGTDGMVAWLERQFEIDYARALFWLSQVFDNV